MSVEPLGPTLIGPRSVLSTILITVVLGATAGYLWIGRGRAATVFFVASAAMLSLAFWRLYEGDAWIWWFAPIAANGLWLWLLLSAFALVLVLPLRGSSRPRKWYARGLGLVLALVGLTALASTFALAVRSFAVQPFFIPAASMQPNLLEGDYVFASKAAYGYGPYSVPFGPWSVMEGERVAAARGDVAIFRSPQNPSVDYISRVIGLPGDAIQIVSGVVLINGRPVPTEAVERPPQMDGLAEQGASFYRETLPEGRSYVIQNLIDGSVGDETVEFVVPVGHYFMMGDNRDHSADSRFQMGYVPEANLVGRVSVIYWNSERMFFRERRDPSSGTTPAN